MWSLVRKNQFLFRVSDIKNFRGFKKKSNIRETSGKIQNKVNEIDVNSRQIKQREKEKKKRERERERES